MEKRISTSWLQANGGPKVELDGETPEGLFGCHDGALYLVVSTDFRKSAIVLRSEVDPKFIVHDMDDDDPVDSGFSLGPVRLRLTAKRKSHSEAEELDQTGMVRIDDHEVSMSCQLLDGTLNWVRVGTVPEPQSVGLPWTHFDGWKLEYPRSGRVLFERTPQDDCKPVPWSLHDAPPSSISEVQVDATI